MSRSILTAVLTWLTVLILVSFLMSSVVVLSLDDTVDPTVRLKVQAEGRTDERSVAQDRSKWGLLLPRAGLPLNGRFADPTGWVLWLTDTDTAAVKVKPDDLAESARRFRFAPGAEPTNWRWVVLRLMYAITGTDLPNTIVLAVLYALGWQAFWGYRSRRRQCQQLIAEWNWVGPAFLTEVFGTSLLATLSLSGCVSKLQDFASRYLAGSSSNEMVSRPVEVLAARVVRAGAMAVRVAGRDDGDRYQAEDDFRTRTRELLEADDQSTAELDYFAQAIPPLGFIGTVLGIGEAMIATRNLAAGGGLSEVAAALGVAFNTTFVALALFLLVEYQGMQARRARGGLVRSIGEFFDTQLFSRAGESSSRPPSPPATSPRSPDAPPSRRPK